MMEPPADVSRAAMYDVQGGWRGLIRHSENVLMAMTLAALVVLPLIEILLRTDILRRFLPVGISGGANPIVKQLVLLLSMLGGALAAREGRLLSLATLTTFLKGRWKSAAHLLSSSVALAITTMLGLAGIQFAQSTLEYDADRTLVGIPIWAIQSILPLGFGVIALRLLRHASQRSGGRVLTLLLAAGLVWIGAHPPVDPEHLRVPAITLLLVATILGAPIFTALGGLALILFWSEGSPAASVGHSHYRIVTELSLAAIPLFTLAGYFLAEGGASKRLIRVFQALFGQLRGGPAIVTVVICVFFTSFTGASGVTILALGGLLMPVLLAARYSPRNATGLLTGAGSLGLLFPPCLPLILYAIVATMTGAQLGADVAQVSIEQMFLGGLLPGSLLVALTAIWGIIQAPKTDVGRAGFDLSEAVQAMWGAKWELLLPVVALVTLFSGFATAVEAAAVTAFYAFIIETFVYRDLRIFKDLPRIMVECGLLIGGVLLILGVAMGFTNYLLLAQVPVLAADWVESTVDSPLVFLLMLNLFLLIVGCLMDIYSAIVIVVPLIVPIALKFGIHPIHLGIIFLANMELGYLTPPVGMNLFLSALRFEKSVPEVIRSVIPMFFVLLIGVLLITYIPPLTTFLPGLFK